MKNFGNISVGQVNCLSMKTYFKWEISVLISSNSIDLSWLKGGWFHFCK